MVKKNFTHLHVHTEYSLLDGSARVGRILDKAIELEMDSLAITDHGNMFGVVDFYKQARKKGIKPILGCEIYVTAGDHRERSHTGENQTYHLVLLAENNQGYKNLIKIVSEGYVNGFYYKPRVNYETLRKYSEGIIALSACLGGEVQKCILNGELEKARKKTDLYRDIFGEDNFFLELQDHHIEEQKKVNRELYVISKEIGVRLVATNDVHYIEKSDAKVHDVLLCIQTGKTVGEEERMRFPSEEFYLKSYDEMLKLFPEEPLENTLEIARRCNVELDFDTLHLPEYKIPDEFESPNHYLRHLCYEGIERKYPEITDEIRDRLEFEISTIENMGYVDYFLIVWDFIKYAKDNDIIVGPGRGSAAGSLASYALDIIDIDPLKYGLVFERFLNPERVSMPDIDIDFCYERREEVIDYVIRKYGEEKVAQIVTFGTMAARGAIRDVGRAIDMEYGKVDTVAKQIPMELGMTIDKALDVNAELKGVYDRESDIKELIDIARAVEGLPRHTSTHAAGVVISKEEVTEYVPLSRNGDNITTQFTMTELEELGLLKMDFLGLRTLTVLRDALSLVEYNHGRKIDIDDLDGGDSKIYEMFASGETLGIFQFESAGMRQVLKELKPTEFENIVAANSLYRPGPMSQIPRYIENKENPDKVEYLHELLEPILDVTYGCMVYQEQVMQIVRDIGGFSMARSDLVRRAMGKKKMDVMEEERKNFIYGKKDSEGNYEIEGALNKGVSEDIANKIYDDMIDFAKYAFNKSHSAAYALVAYRTAWLKYYYPVEYMAALISSVMGNSSSVSLYIHECKRLGIDILPPDINESYLKFTVVGDKMRFGLSAVKNVGNNAIESIIEERDRAGVYTSFPDFCKRVNSTVLNKRMVESLIKCGAFDSLGYKRAQLLAVYERIIDGIQKEKKQNIEGQFSIFDSMDTSQNKSVDLDSLPDIAEFSQKIKLSMEKEMTGIYITGHPLSDYEKMIKTISNATTYDINERNSDSESGFDKNKFVDGSRVKMGGIISSKKSKLTKNNNMMCFIKLEDLFGDIEVVVFPRVYEKYRDMIEEDKIIILEGKLNISEDEGRQSVIADRIRPIEDIEFQNEKIYLKLPEQRDISTLDDIKRILKKYPGKTPVYIYLEKNKKTIKASREIWVDKEEESFYSEIEDLLGRETCKLVSNDK